MAGLNRPDDPPPAASVADPYLDLLATLSYRQRQGLVQRLATGYYDGWRPSRLQIGELIARESGWMSEIDRDNLLALARAPQVPVDCAVPPPAATLPAQVAPPPLASPLTAGAPRAGVTLLPETGPPTGNTLWGAGSLSSFPAATSGGSAPPARPRAMLQFSIPCAGVAGPGEFVARGMSSGPWLTRGNRVCRLVSLHYTLIQPVGPVVFGGSPAFNGAILCRPDAQAPAEPGDGDSTQFLLRSGRVIGVRGPWPIPPTARRVSFLIYPQTAPGDAAQHHPAGSLQVDLTINRAQWLPVSGLRADLLGSGEQRTAPG